MKIILTGGHLTPALSVLEQLKDDQVSFIGRKYSLEGDPSVSMEYKTVTSLGIPFFEIKTGRLQRKLTRYTILSLLKIPYGFLQSFFILRRLKPNVVLGFGGYVSLPVIVAASILRIPIVIHEPTLEAGLANRIASIFALKICISWESSRKFFKEEKTTLTGNPVRAEIIEALDKHSSVQKEENNIPLIYITGGEVGSHAINVLVEKVVKNLLQNFKIIHQTGDAREFQDFERLSYLRDSLPDNLRKRYLIKKFLETSEVAEVLANCDLVVGRAGINTITELIFLQRPALLIPLPFGSEQKKNASFLNQLGLAQILHQENLTSDEFLKTIKYMFENYQKYNLNKDYKIYIRDAAFKITQILADVER